MLTRLLLWHERLLKAPRIHIVCIRGERNWMADGRWMYFRMKQCFCGWSTSGVNQNCGRLLGQAAVSHMAA